MGVIMYDLVNVILIALAYLIPIAIGAYFLFLLAKILANLAGLLGRMCRKEEKK